MQMYLMISPPCFSGINSALPTIETPKADIESARQIRVGVAGEETAPHDPREQIRADREGAVGHDVRQEISRDVLKADVHGQLLKGRHLRVLVLAVALLAATSLLAITPLQVRALIIQAHSR